jgi:hypothetical protein
MDKKEALEIIDKGWIRKPIGYRVHFQKKKGDEWRAVYVPDIDNDVYDSDVVAWRIAWKLSQAVFSPDGEPEMADIYVVDDAGNKIKYYATGDYQVFCPLK